MLLKLQTGIGVPPVSESIVRKYTWGLDLAGLSGSVGQGSALPSQNAGLGGPALQGAGGIGGLLALQQPPQIRSDLNCVYLYDANGNVGQLVEWAPGITDPPGQWDPLRLAARYEYDPYGQPTTRTGHYADHNPFRFSTKAFDDETGLGYWGYRYYSPALGRWVSRDPIGERGGRNLYGYAGNNAVQMVDALGYSLVLQQTTDECPFPAAPRLEDPRGDGWRRHEQDMLNPFVHWSWPGTGQAIYIPADSSWERYVRGLFTTRQREDDVESAVRNAIAAECTTCKRDGARTWTTKSLSTAGDVGKRSAFPSGEWAFLNIGSMYMSYGAECTMRNCCDHCKASCVVTFDLWDSFHWGFKNGVGGTGVAGAYNWHVVYQKLRFLRTPCWYP